MMTTISSLKVKRQRKALLLVPLPVIAFLTLFFWALGGGKGMQANAAPQKAGFNARLPGAKLKDEGKLDKMGYYQLAARDSEKLRQQMKSDPYYQGRTAKDSAPDFTLNRAGYNRSVAPGDKSAAASEARVYQKLVELRTVIDKPESVEHARPTENKPFTEPPHGPALTAPPDPELSQMNGLLEKILDIQHPGRLKTPASPANSVAVKKFRAIPAVVDGTQKIVQGTVICLKLLDTLTLGGQLYSKGQRLYGSGTLANQRYMVNIRSIHVGANFYPVDLTVFDATDGMEGISVPEAVTGDALRDGANSGVQNMDMMAFDPSMTAQLTTAGINTAKNLFGKKIKRVKGKIKDGHALLLRDNLEVKRNH